MKVLKEEFDKTKSILINLSLHIEDIEKKFNMLNKELDNRKQSR
jgi:hypothetical protein